jgi:hypothetical protein
VNVLLDENLSPRLVQLLDAKSIAARHVFAFLYMRAMRRLRALGIEVGVLGVRLPEQPPPGRK